MIGDVLRSRTDETEATEVAIAVAALNRMLNSEPGLCPDRINPGEVGVTAFARPIRATRFPVRHSGSTLPCPFLPRRDRPRLDDGRQAFVMKSIELSLRQKLRCGTRSVLLMPRWYDCDPGRLP